MNVKQSCQLWKQTVTCFVWQIKTSSKAVGTGERKLERQGVQKKKMEVKIPLLSSLPLSTVSESEKQWTNKNMCSASDAINKKSWRVGTQVSVPV